MEEENTDEPLKVSLVIGNNHAPVAMPATADATEDGPIVTGQLMASDPDGDLLTFSPVLTFAPGPAGLIINADGSYSFDPSDPFYQSLAEGETMEILAGYIVYDDSLSDSSTLTITITGVNDAPVFEPSIGEIATTAGASVDFSVAATDIDGDALTFTAEDPEHGTIAGGQDGDFSYTPDAGFVGIDIATIIVSDGNGGLAERSIVVTVNTPDAADWKLQTSDDFAGEIGGSGQVFGTAGFQDITVLDLAGSIRFDASFNQGNDIVRLAGSAEGWQIMRSGSSAIFTDGDTFIEIPIGVAGLELIFGDGVRTLYYDVEQGTAQIGTQAFGSELVQIAAPPELSLPPPAADPEASARLLLTPGASVTAGGHLEIFGTSGDETVTLTQGEASFDASFNLGGDRVILAQEPGDFTAVQSGSSVLLDGTQTNASIPVGDTGLQLDFPGNDERTLIYDTELGAIMIGEQVIGTAPVVLADLV